MTDSQKEHLDEVAGEEARAGEVTQTEEKVEVKEEKSPASDPYRGEELKPTWPLLVETFHKWKEHWKLFVGVSLIGGGAMAVTALIGGAGVVGAGFASGLFTNVSNTTEFFARAISSPSFVATVISGAVVIGAVMLIISTWMALAQVMAWRWVRGEEQSDMRIRTAYKSTWPLVPSYIWISILATVFVVIGVIGFVVPGILLGTAFAVLPMIAIAEKGKGMAALRRAGQLVRPHLWWTLWRFIFTGVILFLPAAIVFGIIGGIFGKDVSDFLNQVYEFLAGPIFAGVVYATYLELKGMNPGEEKSPTLMKLSLILGGIAGVILVGLIVAGVVTP